MRQTQTILNRLISQRDSGNEMKLPYSVSSQSNVRIVAIDDTAKAGLTMFCELFTKIPCAPSHLKIIKNIVISRHLGLKLTSKGSLKVEEVIS